jgi:diguanylate cyclase (GGDEF)-like protein
MGPFRKQMHGLLSQWSRGVRTSVRRALPTLVIGILSSQTIVAQTAPSGQGPSGWVWAAAVLVAVAIFLFAVRLRTRALVAEKSRLEETVAALRDEIAAAKSQLEEATFTDPLTGLRNRSYFSATIDGEVLRVLRAYAAAGNEGQPRKRDLIFYLIDLDDFKAVNDLYGQDAGDRVLAETATRLHSIARQSDLVVRWGGEEFMVVCRDAQRAEAERLARRILETIGKQAYDAGGGREARLTCSIGWAAFPWLTGDAPSRSYEEVLTIVDRARQLAKETGKNRAFGAVPSETDAGSLETGAISFDTTVAMGPGRS